MFQNKVELFPTLQFELMLTNQGIFYIVLMHQVYYLVFTWACIPKTLFEFDKNIINILRNKVEFNF